MKTRCYCIYCPKHPLFNRRKEFSPLTGYAPGDYIDNRYEESGADVECLIPDSDAFLDYNIDPEDEEFEITAYADGFAQTGFVKTGIVLYAVCRSEGYAD
jgi:hypothetical protein